MIHYFLSGYIIIICLGYKCIDVKLCMYRRKVMYVCIDVKLCIDVCIDVKPHHPADH